MLGGDIIVGVDGHAISTLRAAARRDRAEEAGRQDRARDLPPRLEEDRHRDARAGARRSASGSPARADPGDRPRPRLPARAAAVFDLLALPCARWSAGRSCSSSTRRRRGRGALGGRRERRPRRVVLRPHRSVPVPRGRLHFIAEFMTAAHLILVWETTTTRICCKHAARARDVGRNPRVDGLPLRVRAERVVLRLGRGRPARARRPRQHVIEQHFGERAAVLARRRGGADDPRRGDARAGRRGRRDPDAASRAASCRGA